jgi:mevalonate kinase
MTRARAPGKAILFGEHAVVYGRPAIAVPVHPIHATAEVADLPQAPAGAVFLESEAAGTRAWLNDLPDDDPLRRITQSTLDRLPAAGRHALSIHITSTIPIASGLGSGAAVSVAIARAVSQHLGQPLPNEDVSDLAFDVERLHHGTPSGIDNTVISYETLVYFVRGQPIERITVGTPFNLVIGDTGVAAPTALAVASVRRRWEGDRQSMETLFDSIGDVVRRARTAVESGHVAALGSLMNENQTLLAQMGVSSPELDRLIDAASGAGASGAKLSGGGMGGNMIAVVAADRALAVAAALLEAGASRAFAMQVGP